MYQGIRDESKKKNELVKKNRIKTLICHRASKKIALFVLHGAITLRSLETSGLLSLQGKVKALGTVHYWCICPSDIYLPLAN